MSDYYKLKKLTDCSWVNLFEVLFKRKTDSEKTWLMCSRKENPIADVNPDAVVIIATINSSSGKSIFYVMPSGNLHCNSFHNFVFVTEIENKTSINNFYVFGPKT